MEELIARLKNASDWQTDLIDEIGQTVITASEDGTLATLVDETCEGCSDDASPNLQLLCHLTSARRGRDPEATNRLASLIEKVNQSGRWNVLAHVARAAMDTIDDPSLSRYIARAGEEGGLDVLPEGSLQRALVVTPENHRLLWLRGVELETKEDETAQEFYAHSLVGWAKSKDVEKVDDCVLKLLENPNAETWGIAWSGLDNLAKHGETASMISFLDFAMHESEELGLMDRIWKTLRRLLETGDKRPEIRRLAARAAEGSQRKIKSIERIVERSGLRSSDVNIETALKEYDRFLKYAPGLLVVHSGWGVGTIQDNDGEAIVVDFPQKPAHRMTLTIAGRSLDILPPDDLRTYILTDLDYLKRLAKEDPAELMLIALRKARGEASTSELRKLLVPDVFTAQTWSSWLKKAATAAESDDRIDTTQTFRKVYRVLETNGSAQLVPPIQEKTDVHQNLEMIHRFLTQHPEAEAEAKRIYRPRIVQWLGSIDKIEAQVHLLNVLRRWDERSVPRFIEKLTELLDGGGDFSFTTLAHEQLDLLTAAEEAGMGAGAALAGFPSRHADVRRRAAQIFADQLGEKSERFIRDLYSHSPSQANRILGLVEFSCDNPETIPAALADPWQAGRAIIAIVNLTTREPLRRRARSLLKIDGPLGRQLSAKPIDEENALLLEKQLTSWRTTDRHLFPALDFLEASGGTDVVARVREHRSAQSARFVSMTLEASESQNAILMTRKTIERLRDEIAELELALKTTIPEKIRVAMAHGDLSENAEYDAAKLKQQQYNARLVDLQEQIGAARAIEDVRQEPGVAGPGSEIITEDLADGSHHTYWVLGEGDSQLGSSVVSYRAPLGAALTGHREGAEVTVVLQDGERRLKIVSIRRKLP